MDEDESDNDVLIHPEVWEMVQVGNAVRLDYGPGKRTNQLRHILAIVDDEYVVYRVWMNRWVYQVDWIYRFELEWQGGYLKKA